MSRARSERLMNLLIALLVARQPVTKERLRTVIEGYQDSSDDAFEKMFERDKEELRGLGIPIELAALDKFFDDEQGYTINRSDLELPELTLAPDEAAVIGLAAQVWQHAGLAEATSSAVLKLKAGGAEVERAALDLVQPAVNAVEPAFGALWEATAAHSPVSFDYRRGSARGTQTRHLEPWGMLTARGRWYVVGLDTDRGEPRMFRLSRITGPVVVQSGTFVVPPGTDVRSLATMLAPKPAEHTATVRLRPGRAQDLRRRAAESEPGEEWDRVRIDYADPELFSGELASHLDAVVVDAPADLRALVVARLRTAAGLA